MTFSNANIYLQKKIIERITGMSYESFVTKRLLQPVHLKGEFIELPSGRKDIARAFDNNFIETVYTEKSLSLLLSADDPYEWCKSLHSFQILSKKSVDQLGKRFGDNEGSLGNVNFVL